MLATIGKGVLHIKTEDLREYLTNYQEEKKSSKVTIDNIRRILSSFFTWLEDEDYILKSPVRRIHKVKAATVVKETYSDEEIEVMRDGCDNSRDLALIDMLASTGMRVGELVLLNREDINFEERECVVFGKDSKERIVYFDAGTKIHLQEYLEGRTDDNEALFVSLKAPYDRLQIGGIEVRLRNHHAHIVQGNKLCDTRYLCYLLNSIDLSGYITGSVQPKLSQSNLNAITLFLPEINVQRKIVEYLYMLDKKITVNQLINRNESRYI